MSATEPPPGFMPAGFSPGFLDRGGPYWLKRGPDGDVVGLRIDPGHMNYQDMAHGGVITTLADVALSWRLHASATPPLPVSTATLTVNFLGPARLGDWLEAEARIDRLGGRLAHTSGVIRCGETVIATMTGVFSVLRKS